MIFKTGTRPSRDLISATIKSNNSVEPRLTATPEEQTMARSSGPYFMHIVQLSIYHLICINLSIYIMYVYKRIITCRLLFVKKLAYLVKLIQAAFKDLLS